jgi:hypothetical protein
MIICPKTTSKFELSAVSFPARANEVMVLSSLGLTDMSLFKALQLEANLQPRFNVV